MITVSNDNRVETTLFMLMSVDGKISTGDNDNRDTDKDLHRIDGIKEGLHQYYDLEQQTDLFSLNTGRVMAKIGVNERIFSGEKLPVTFVIIDNQPHLQQSGVEYILNWTRRLIIVTTNKNHPAFEMKNENLKVMLYESEVDFEEVFVRLKKEYGADRLTVQSGGTLNSVLLRKGLIDHVSIVVAPALIGGKNTATLIDGTSLSTEEDLKHIRPLRLQKCTVLQNSYIHLQYDVVNG